MADLMQLIRSVPRPECKLYRKTSERLFHLLKKGFNSAFPFHGLTPPLSPGNQSGVAAEACRRGLPWWPGPSTWWGQMASSEPLPTVNPGAAEGEEETILYDLLVNTEWPPGDGSTGEPGPAGLHASWVPALPRQNLRSQAT